MRESSLIGTNRTQSFDSVRLTIYPKNPEISNGMLMERLILSPRTEIFSGKWDFLKGRSKFPNGISEWKMSVSFGTLSARPVRPRLHSTSSH